MTPPGPQPTPEAELVFADYLSQLEDGGVVDFESFCTSHGPLAPQLRRLKSDWDRMGGVVDELGTGFPDELDSAAEPTVAVDDDHDHEPSKPAPPSSASGVFPVAEVLERLTDRPIDSDRYAPRGEIARGGMGIVLRMWDGDLRRNLAMKVMRDRSGASDTDKLSDTRKVGRFLEEAQITGQLDHPGIVPVHELGLDSDGRLYFTMRLVRGRHLRKIFELVHERSEGWTVARALGVVLRVCEAMAYAHSKRVIHRDIKPSNIMVGRFGEVYVMDWGLAKVMGRRDLHDIRPLTTVTGSLSAVRTDRHDEASASPDSPLVTMDGSVVGTPAYMSPEQARGQIDKVGPASDVYATGALLYELLTGRMPYIDDQDEQVSPYTVLNAVREGPPRPVHHVDSSVPHELVAISEKAMARAVGDRYDSMLAMAEDLRAFLEGRVVAAYEGGAVAELRKWILRNKLTAAILSIALLTLSWLTLDLATKNEQLSQKSGALENQLRITQEERNQKDAARRGAEQAAGQARLSAEAAERSADHARWTSYVSSIAAADGSLRFHEPSEARRRLDEAPASLRGWEWQHLALVSDPSLAVFKLHAERVTCVAFDPTGERVASGSWDGTARVGRMDGSSLPIVLDNGVGVSAVAFQPDGRRLALADYDGRVSFWDPQSGERLRSLPATGAGPTPVNSLAFHPDGELLFVASGRRVRAWRLLSERWVTFPEVNRSTVNALAISHDGESLISGSDDTTLQVWDAHSGIPRLEMFQHQGPVLGVAHSPVDHVVATGGEDGIVRLFDPQRGRALLALAGHRGPVRSVDFSPDGARVLSAGDDGTLRVWDAYTGAALQVLTGHEDRVLAARFSTDGQLLASGSIDRTVRLWDVAWGAGRPALSGHADVISSLAVASGGPSHASSQKGPRVASAAWDGRLRLWDVDALASLAIADLAPITSAAVAFRPDGRRLAAGLESTRSGERHPIIIWDSSRHDALGLDPLILEGHDEPINALAYGPAGRLLASASDDRRVRLWNADNGELVADLEGHAGWVADVAFHPTEPWLASGGYDETVRLWSTEGRTKGRALGELPGHDGPVLAVAFDPTGRLLATGSHDKLVRVFDCQSKALLHTLTGHQDDVLALAFHPSATRLASASTDGTVRLWDTATGMHLLTLRLGRPSRSLAFDSAGGRLFAAAGNEVLILETNPPSRTFDARQEHALVIERAQATFDAMLDELLDPRAVQVQLQDDQGLDDAVRTEALRLARNFGTQPDRLAEMAWNLLTDRHAGQDAHELALRLARAADRMRPENPRFVNTLGVALYRTGRHSAALNTLERSRKANARRDLYPPGWDLLFMAMAHARLGYQRLANTHLDEALSVSPGDPITLALETEARELVEGR